MINSWMKRSEKKYIHGITCIGYNSIKKFPGLILNASRSVGAISLMWKQPSSIHACTFL